MAAERNGSVRAATIENDSIAQIRPLAQKWVDPSCQLMTDGHQSYGLIGRQFASHMSVAHSQKEYVRGVVHINTTESFAAMLERAKQGVFHYLSKSHLHRYLHEIEFRWQHRIPVRTVMRKGKTKIIRKPRPTMELLQVLLSAAAGRQIRRTANNSVFTFA